MDWKKEEREMEMENEQRRATWNVGTSEREEKQGLCLCGMCVSFFFCVAGQNGLKFLGLCHFIRS